MASLCVRVKGAGKEEQPVAPMAREGVGLPPQSAAYKDALPASSHMQLRLKTCSNKLLSFLNMEK